MAMKCSFTAQGVYVHKKMHLHGTDVLGPTERTNANQISSLEMHKQGRIRTMKEIKAQVLPFNSLSLTWQGTCV